MGSPVSGPRSNRWPGRELEDRGPRGVLSPQINKHTLMYSMDTMNLPPPPSPLCAPPAGCAGPGRGGRLYHSRMEEMGKL